MASASTERQRARRARLSAAGLCWISKCGRPAASGKALCFECGKKEAARLVERRNRLRAERKCRNCQRPVEAGFNSCDECRARAAASTTARYAMRRFKAGLPPPGSFHPTEAVQAALRAFYAQETGVCKRCGAGKAAFYVDLYGDVNCRICGAVVKYAEPGVRGVKVTEGLRDSCKHNRGVPEASCSHLTTRGRVAG